MVFHGLSITFGEKIKKHFVGTIEEKGALKSLSRLKILKQLDVVTFYSNLKSNSRGNHEMVNILLMLS